MTGGKDKKPAGIPVGVDDGYASTKVYGGNGVCIKIRSSVRSGAHGLSSIMGNAADSGGCYETEGTRYTVGDMIDGEGTRFDDYPGSPLNRVVVHHALKLAGYAGQQVRIATGLPVDAFYRGGGMNTELIDRKRKSFKIPVSDGGGGDTAEILSSIVCAEAVSAWLDNVLDDNGRVVKGANMTHPVGVVDIGGRTTDCVWVSPPDMVDQNRSGSENVGVLDLLEMIGNELRNRFNLSSISRQALEQAAIDRSVRLYGQTHDVSDIVAAASEEISDRVYREIQRRLGSGAELDAIIFVGGGAALLPGIASRFRNSVTPDRPEFANARGMYKYLRHLD